MGANSSSISELKENEYLLRLSGNESISANDPFWNQLLSFTFQLQHTVSDNRLLEESTSSISKSFAINNCRTGNFGALVRVYLRRAAELKASVQTQDNLFTWQTYNALFIIRNICKYFLENLSEEVIKQEFETKPKSENGETDIGTDADLIDEFMNSLIEVITDVPITHFTYALHLEALNTILVLLSTQMFTTDTASHLNIYQYIMRGKSSRHASLLMKTLLLNFIRQDKCPQELIKNHGGGGVLYGITAAVASGLWTAITLGMGNKTETPEEIVDTLIANQSLVLILILTNHCTSDQSLANPYRHALFSFTNAQEVASSDQPTPEPEGTFEMDFPKLYDALCKTLKDDQTTLLLYLLLHRNTSMKAFILSRTNSDQLVMPILKILYHAQEKNSHHIYMALIIILILSEDEVFNKGIHETMLKNVLWFKERQISEITLGGLLVLVVIRTIQYNMTRMRDKYLHTNCLAALANMSAQFSALHPYVTQRIVSLFAQLCKKHTRLVEQIRNAAAEFNKNQESGSEGDYDQDMVSQCSEDSFLSSYSYEDLVQDLSVLEEVIRMVLEIINSCLTHSLHHNPNLVYTLLYKKELFLHFRTHPTFQDIIQNIDTVLSYFTSKVEQQDKNVSVEQVKDVIDQGIRQFRKDRLKKFPELKFKYVEEDSPEEFFIPYVWSLVYHSSNLYFNPDRIQLFTLTT